MEEENDEGFPDFQDMPSVLQLMAVAENGVCTLSLCLACSLGEKFTALIQNPCPHDRDEGLKSKRGPNVQVQIGKERISNSPKICTILVVFHGLFGAFHHIALFLCVIRY